MVDLEVLSKFGVSAEAWKEKLNKPKESRSEKINQLVDRIRGRIQGGRDFNIERYQVHYALDQAWDSAFAQITPTLLSTLRDKTFSDRNEIMDTLRQWGMDPNEVLREVPDNKTPGTNTVKIDTPAFFRVFVPLVAAYVKIRWAKIINDRRMVPLFKYDPVISDQLNRMKCDMLTGRVEKMSREYGYFEILKQAVFRMLHYSECCQFPIEEWHQQCGLVEQDSPYQEQEIVNHNGESFKKIIIKEGIRYHLPHPTRTYYDRGSFASTFNSDSGASYAGYWRVLRYIDIYRNKSFFNLGQIGFKDFADWFEGKRAHSYWKNVLGGCAVTFPDHKTTEGAGGKYDNEKTVADWYSQDMMDRPIVISEHFEKIIPKECGLGDYEYEVWARFVVAADNEIIYAAPLPYCPVVWYGYDSAEGRTNNASMSLEILPFQDQFTNLLTQLLLTTKQNLANATLVDTDLVDEKDITEIKNWGESWYRGINIIRASFKKMFQKQQVNSAAGFISHKFPMGDTQSIIASMKVILDTLERVLVMSAQEVGQSATHEQTREEVKTISQNTSTRVTFTSIGVDTARDAWKRQIYNGLMAYGQDEVWGEVPFDEPIDEEKLKTLGFTIAGPYNPKTRKQYLKANSTALKYEMFASDRDGLDRVNDAETAQAMLLMLDKALNNQMLAPAIGVDQAIAILNQVCKYLDFPRDFKLVNTGQTQTITDQVMQALEEMKGMVDQQLAGIQEDAQGALKEVTLKNKEQDVVLMDISSKLNRLLEGANQIQMPRMPAPADSDALLSELQSEAAAV